MECVALPQTPNQVVVRAKMYEVNNMGTSSLKKKNFAVQKVLRAGIWKSQTTFSSLYIRDVTHRSLDTFSVGPVVAAQQVVKFWNKVLGIMVILCSFFYFS